MKNGLTNMNRRARHWTGQGVHSNAKEGRLNALQGSFECLPVWYLNALQDSV